MGHSLRAGWRAIRVPAHTAPSGCRGAQAGCGAGAVGQRGHRGDRMGAGRAERRMIPWPS
nr:MAG TPA: hypothetical protein [Caudoviricetes sp.]